MLLVVEVVAALAVDIVPATTAADDPGGETLSELGWLAPFHAK